MTKIEVFDPPMCCSSGICGHSSDPTLVNFASDLEWLKKQGVQVARHGLALEPTEFVKNPAVTNLLNKKGNDCLPIITIGTTIISDGYYPSREKLASICKIEYNEEEAPPIHREENFDIPSKCNCADAAAEDNCFSEPQYSLETPPEKFTLKMALITAFWVVAICFIAYVFYSFSR